MPCCSGSVGYVQRSDRFGRVQKLERPVQHPLLGLGLENAGEIVAHPVRPSGPQHYVIE